MISRNVSPISVEAASPLLLLLLLACAVCLVSYLARVLHEFVSPFSAETWPRRLLRLEEMRPVPSFLPDSARTQWLACCYRSVVA
jgi:hypothetical protein